MSPQGTLLTEQQIQAAVNTLMNMLRNNNIPFESAKKILLKALNEINSISGTTIVE